MFDDMVNNEFLLVQEAEDRSCRGVTEEWCEALSVEHVLRLEVAVSALNVIANLVLDSVGSQELWS